MITWIEEKSNGLNISQRTRLILLQIDNVFVCGAKDQRW